LKQILLLSLLCLFINACSKEKDIKNIHSAGQNIICFGNSLTSGVGASAGNDYPSILAKNLDFPVINAGRPGDTTIDALKRIGHDVLHQKPRLVIVEFGGNDFLQGVPEKQTLKNLDRIVKKIQDAGAIVVLVQIRTSLWKDSYLSGVRKIAQRRRAVLINDILKGIITNSRLKTDYLHPNDEGYKIIAFRILKAIKPLLY
jgi:acyl-CoA thioesterase-1